MSKIAAKKTAGVLGDNLALNTQQVSGVNADRELPVVWAKLRNTLGRAILAFCPVLMKSLSVIGTAAMFFVGEGIIAHGIGPLHHQIELLIQGISYQSLVAMGLNLLVGVFAGVMSLFVIKSGGLVYHKLKNT